MAAVPENHNVFAGAFVDRTGERRKDPDWLARAIDDPDSRFLPVWGDRCLVHGSDRPRARLLDREEANDFLHDPDELVFLGLFGDRQIRRDRDSRSTTIDDLIDRSIKTILLDIRSNYLCAQATEQ